MPDLTTILNKFQNSPLQRLRYYQQNPAQDIDTMLNNVLDEFIDDIEGITAQNQNQNQNQQNQPAQSVLTVDERDFCKQIFANSILTNLVDKSAQDSLNQLFANRLACYSDRRFDNIYLSQALRDNKMPEPSSKCVYIAQDVTDAAKQYDTNPNDQTRSALLASLAAFYNNVTALFVLLDDEKDFDSMKGVINTALNSAGKTEIPQDFKLDGKIFEGMFLRANYTLAAPENDFNSEARIITSLLLNIYQSKIIPTKTVESIIPNTLIFFNAKKLARSSVADLLTAKNNIGQLVMLDKERILSFAKMASLEETLRNANKATTLQNQLNNLLKGCNSQLAKKAPKFVIREINMDRVKKKIMIIEKKMKNLDVSRNPTYHNFDTYQRPNRREPANPDMPGESIDLGYYPDIHLYVDTSGSITERDYEDSVAMIIDIAKKLNCDIYFNSFTTDISQETVVRCRDRSKAQIQKDILKIPKITGGTSIDQVWNYINSTQKNRRQLSILISDFYVDIPRYIKHPKNLYYIPTKDTSTQYAETFASKLPNPWRVLF